MKKILFVLIILLFLINLGIGQTSKQNQVLIAQKISGSVDCDPTVFTGTTNWTTGDQTTLSVLNNDDPVSTWLDRNSVRTWTGVLTERPLFKKNSGPNSLSYVAFDTSNDVLTYSNTVSDLISASAYTVFAVVRPQANGTNDSAWFCPQIVGTINGFFGLSLQSNGSGNKFALWQDRCSPAPRTNSISSTTTYVLNTWYIVEAWWDGTNMNIKVNNDTTASLAYNNVCSLANTPSMGPKSDVAALYVWNTDIGSTNRTTMRQCLSTRWSITLN